MGYAVAWGLHTELWRISGLQHLRPLPANLSVVLVAGGAGLVVAYGALMALGVSDVKLLLTRVAKKAGLAPRGKAGA